MRSLNPAPRPQPISSCQTAIGVGADGAGGPVQLEPDLLVRAVHRHDRQRSGSRTPPPRPRSLWRPEASSRSSRSSRAVPARRVIWPARRPARARTRPRRLDLADACRQRQRGRDPAVRGYEPVRFRRATASAATRRRPSSSAIAQTVNQAVTNSSDPWSVSTCRHPRTGA